MLGVLSSCVLTQTFMVKVRLGIIELTQLRVFLIQHGIFSMRKDIHYYNDFILCFARYHLLLWLFIVQPGIDCGITKQHLKLLG